MSAEYKVLIGRVRILQVTKVCDLETLDESPGTEESQQRNVSIAAGRGLGPAPLRVLPTASGSATIADGTASPAVVVGTQWQDV